MQARGRGRGGADTKFPTPRFAPYRVDVSSTGTTPRRRPPPPGPVVFKTGATATPGGRGSSGSPATTPAAASGGRGTPAQPLGAGGRGKSSAAPAGRGEPKQPSGRGAPQGTAAVGISGRRAGGEEKPAGGRGAPAVVGRGAPHLTPPSRASDVPKQPAGRSTTQPAASAGRGRGPAAAVAHAAGRGAPSSSSSSSKPLSSATSGGRGAGGGVTGPPVLVENGSTSRSTPPIATAAGRGGMSAGRLPKAVPISVTPIATGRGSGGVSASYHAKPAADKKKEFIGGLVLVDEEDNVVTPPGEPAPDPSMPTFRLITWNVNGPGPTDNNKVEAIAKHLAGLFPDAINLTELRARITAEAIAEQLRFVTGSRWDCYFHEQRGRKSDGLHLALLWRTDRVRLDSVKRFDNDATLSAPVTDPDSGKTIMLCLRRGYLAELSLARRDQRKRPIALAGVHLQSLRGSSFSHYKRQMQARIVRAAMQRFLRTHDIIIAGDLNSAETDAAISPLKDRSAGRGGRLADHVAEKRWEQVVPSSQRTFVVETLRALDVATPRLTLSNTHRDGAPTWRRGGASTQLDHVLYRFEKLRGDVPGHRIAWSPDRTLSDHAAVMATFEL